MCGISGIYSFKQNNGWLEKARIRVSAMNETERHRGPDDTGLWDNGRKLVLGHDRLSILDLSSAGHQPMMDPDTGNVIVFNGEIYNYRAIRKALQGQGVVFSSETDTEVILKGYSFWGIDGLVRQLNGIFAFALWDRNADCLILCRDHMGVKPLYYYTNETELVFASEVRSVLAAGVEKKLSPEGLYSYLMYGSVQEPFTLIEGIRSLPPASYARIGGGAEEIRFVRYWNPVDGFIESSQYQNGDSWRNRGKIDALSAEEIEGRVRDILNDSVSNQMISDVPLGAFLSGGIDSSSIVSVMRRMHSDAELHTFSIVFDEASSDYDEREYARLAAERNGTVHTELLMTGDLLRANVGAALDSFDQPSVDGLNTWFVSKLVKDSGITVSISGVGGDELFCGYDRFSGSVQSAARYAKLNKLPSGLGHFLDRYGNSHRLRRTGQYMYWPHDSYFLTRCMGTLEEVAPLLHLDIDGRKRAAGWFAKSYSELEQSGQKLPDELSRISYFEQRSYMLSTLLRDTDQMGMANSLEIRVPLIDYRLSEFLTSLSEGQKTDVNIPKVLLVKAAGSGLPKECVFRKKMGFSFPFDKYFRESLKDELEDFFLGGSASDIFNKKSLQRVWNDFLSGRASWTTAWKLYVLERWMRKNGISN